MFRGIRDKMVRAPERDKRANQKNNKARPASVPRDLSEKKPVAEGRRDDA